MENKHKFEGLDALRGILSIIVVIAHSWQIFISPVDGSDTLLGNTLGLMARFAVILFFCLSGYVIALSVSKNIERFGSFKILPYAKSRALRIAPPLLIVFVLFFVVAYIARKIGIDSLPDGVIGARDAYVVDIRQQIECIATLCINNHDLTGVLNGPLWSLKYEIQLYVIFGLFSAVCFSRMLPVRLICAAAAIYYIYKSSYVYIASDVFDLQLLWFSMFGFGVAAFFLFNNVRKFILITVVMAGILACIAIFFFFGNGTAMSRLDRSVEFICAQIFFAIAGSSFVIFMSRINVGKRLSSLGDYSFTLYITHFPILLFGYFAVVHIAPHYSQAAGFGLAIIGAVCCVLLAKLTFRIIEHPLRWIAFFHQRRGSLKPPKDLDKSSTTAF